MISKYQWTVAKYVKLTEIASNKLVRSGISCCFFPMSKTVGAKLYRNRVSRDRSLEHQKHAYAHGLAPNSGNPFEFDCMYIDFFWDFEGPLVKKRRVYGYLTQIAKVDGRVDPIKRSDRMWRKLRAIGLDHLDLHGTNIGWINGKEVCIDFDMFSCNKVRGRKKNGRSNKTAQRR